jgi:hypothetical protein
MQKVGEERTYLENQATDARLRLEDRLHALFERRRAWTATARRLAHPPAALLLAAGLGLTALVLVAQRARRRRLPWYQRPELLALLRSQPVSEKGFVRQTVDKTVRSLLANAARQLGRRGVEQFVRRGQASPQGPARSAEAHH